MSQIEFLNNLQLLTAKPAVYLVNMSEKDYLRQKNKYLKKVMDWVKEHTGEPVIPFSAEFEKKVELSSLHLLLFVSEG